MPCLMGAKNDGREGRLIMYSLNTPNPSSIADAAAQRSANEDASYLAGGMTLIPTLKQRLAQP